MPVSACSTRAALERWGGRGRGRSRSAPASATARPPLRCSTRRSHVRRRCHAARSGRRLEWGGLLPNLFSTHPPFQIDANPASRPRSPRCSCRAEWAASCACCPRAAGRADDGRGAGIGVRTGRSPMSGRRAPHRGDPAHNRRRGSHWPDIEHDGHRGRRPCSRAAPLSWSAPMPGAEPSMRGEFVTVDTPTTQTEPADFDAFGPRRLTRRYCASARRDDRTASDPLDRDRRVRDVAGFGGTQIRASAARAPHGAITAPLPGSCSSSIRQRRGHALRGPALAGPRATRTSWSTPAGRATATPTMTTPTRPPAGGFLTRGLRSPHEYYYRRLRRRGAGGRGPPLVLRPGRMHRACRRRQSGGDRASPCRARARPRRRDHPGSFLSELNRAADLSNEARTPC